MKKLLGLLIATTLLMAVGFLYVVKNPDTSISQKILTTLGIDITNKQSHSVDLTNCLSYFDGCNTCMVSGGVVGGCTKMFCETPSEPYCMEYERTGMDLSNCISYFDGCNNCTVENGRPSACTLMYCETPSEPKCNEYASGAVNNESVGLANPASTNCIDNGGKLEIVTQADGGQVGMCTLKDGTVCEERAYMRGQCGATTNNGTPVACTEEAKMCNDGSAVGRTGPNCEFAPCPEEATVCTMQYDPVCASVAVQCIKAPCPPIEQTFGNMCMMNANKLAKFLYKGECKTK